LAPSDVVRRRLALHPDLVAKAAAVPPHIDDPAWAATVDAVTVQETRLFRSPVQLEFLRAVVLPELVRAARARGARRLRLLSAGCATGEEAWTLAVLATDALAGADDVASEVVGIDLSRPALRAAASGTYPSGPLDPLRDVPARFRPCFITSAASVAAAEPLHGAVRFARANLLRVGDFDGFDAILCRNVCIYLTDNARRAVAGGLAGLLRPGGALLLGPTDSAPAGMGLRPWSRDTVSVFRGPDAGASHG
jgi:chemotaxis protein methyltransferase CheR